MAVVTASIGIVDDLGLVRRTPMRFARGTLTLAQMSAMVNNYCNLLLPLTDGRIAEANILIPVALSGAITGAAGKPVANTDADVGATLSIRNSAGVRDSVFIPSFVHGSQSADIPLTGDADIEALVDAWVNGVSDGTTDQPLVDLNELDIVEAVKLFRSKRK